MDKDNKNLEVLFNAFIGLVVIISSILTFGFFYEFLPNFLPVELVGEDISKVFSGLLGMLILDLGSLMWLYTNLKLAENESQRTVTLFASIIDFVGSLITSFTFLVITGQKLYSMPDTMRNSVGMTSLISIASILVYNFLSIWLYKRNSEESRKDIAEGKRIQKMNDVFRLREEALDKDVEKLVREQFNKAKPDLAKAIAERHIQIKMEDELARLNIGTNGKFSTYTAPIADEQSNVAAESVVGDAPVARLCKWCKTPLPEDAPGTVKYCTDKPCRDEYIAYKRENAKKLSSGLDVTSNL